MLTPDAERIIRRAARAQLKYFGMLRDLDMVERSKWMERRIAIDAELRGDRSYLERPPLPADLTIPLHRAVSRELVALRPYVTVEVQRRREQRRIMGCSPFSELRISKSTTARARLRQVWKESGLSLREIALILGVARTTLERHAAGGTIARTRRDWYLSLKGLTRDDEGNVHVIVAAPPPVRGRRAKWGAHLSEEQRRQALADTVDLLDRRRDEWRRPKY